jgi:hypothetical protein
MKPSGCSRRRVVAVLGFADVRSQEPQSELAPASEGLVLETAETLEFDTNQVTWASLDVSPDGKTIVFDLLGDLYTLPTEGGTATRIIGGLSFESQPVYSPDGKTIAFLRSPAPARDTLPRYDFTPDGQSLIVPIAAAQAVLVGNGAEDAANKGTHVFAVDPTPPQRAKSAHCGPGKCAARH